MPFTYLSSPMSPPSEMPMGLINQDMTAHHTDEELVPDSRSELRPAQMVEDRLSGMLRGDCLMVSQLRLKRYIGARS